MKCPTCNKEMTELSQEEKTVLKSVQPDFPDDEDVYRCWKCKELIFEEDLYYNTEE